MSTTSTTSTTPKKKGGGGRNWSYLESLTAVVVVGDVFADDENGTDFKAETLQVLALDAFKNRANDYLTNPRTDLDEDKASTEWLQRLKQDNSDDGGNWRTGRSIIDRAKEMRRIFNKSIRPEWNRNNRHDPKRGVLGDLPSGTDYATHANNVIKKALAKNTENRTKKLYGQCCPEATIRYFGHKEFMDAVALLSDRGLDRVQDDDSSSSSGGRGGSKSKAKRALEESLKARDETSKKRANDNMEFLQKCFDRHFESQKDRDARHYESQKDRDARHYESQKDRDARHVETQNNRHEIQKVRQQQHQENKEFRQRQHQENKELMKDISNSFRTVSQSVGVQTKLAMLDKLIENQGLDPKLLEKYTSQRTALMMQFLEN